METFANAYIAQFGLVGLALVIVWKLIDRIPRKGPMNSDPKYLPVVDLAPGVKQAIYTASDQTAQLHGWHAPNAAGVQTWKDQSQLVNAIERMETAIVTELKEVRLAVNGGAKESSR